MGKMSRDKGKVGEREVAALLREFGFEGRRGVQYRGGSGSADVEGLPGFHIEVKRVEKFNLDAAYAQAVTDADGKATPVVFHRKSDKPWAVVMDAKHFLNLVRGGGGR